MHKILIVDDERPAREFISGLVTFYIPDSEVAQAESAGKALECMQRENYDLLFVDNTMPGMSGLELLEELNRRGKSPYSFIIAAPHPYDYALQGFRLGILDYIEKPLYREKIYEAVNLYLSKVKANFLDLKVSNGVCRILFHNLLAIETVSRGKVKVYTTDSILPEVSGSLVQLCKQLPLNFCYIRRDCIINLHKVTHYNPKLQYNEIFLVYQNEEIMFNVSRKHIKDLLMRLNLEN